MQFAIIFHETPEALSERTGEKAAAYWSSWSAYFGALGEKTQFGACLKGPETGAVLRVNGSGRDVQDGPYAETKEQLGGFYVVEVANLDTALEWAKKIPLMNGSSVEVRPVPDFGDDG